MVATAQGDELVIATLKQKLQRGALTLPQKYRVLCSLRNCSNASALDALLVALQDDSALFRHDVAFALGQRQDPAAVAALVGILSDQSEHGMVRHEAAEALGAINTPECTEPVQQHQTCNVREVAETCALASQRMAHFDGCAGQAVLEQSKFLSVDPTPAYPASVPAAELSAKLHDEACNTFDRYRALFALRNMGGSEAVTALAACLRHSSSALLKHEVAYVMGQMLDRRSIACLQECLRDEQEHAMVRHEAAEALGAVGDDECVALLQSYSKDPCQIVADSCIVALDMIDHEKSGLHEYADMGSEA